MMVQGHVFYAILETSVKGATKGWYPWHSYVHGYTAPIFFFSSGLAFGITTLRTWEQHLGFTKAVRKRFERYAILLLIGYGMHASALTLRRMLALSREELAPILQMDTLQNIAVFLLVTELLVICLRKPVIFAWVSGLLGAAVVIAAPWLWRMDVSSWPVGLAAMVNESTGSIFPIPPWSGFISAGVVTAYLLWDEKNRRFRNKPYVLLGLGGVALAALSYVLSEIGYEPWGEHNRWKTGPYFFLTRVGVVWMVLAVFSALEVRFEAVRSSKVSIGIQRLGQETLVVYVAHLLVLYGTPWTPSLYAAYPDALTLGQSTLVFVVLFAVMVVFALLWREWKVRWPRGFDITRWTITAIALLFFLLGPGPS